MDNRTIETKGIICGRKSGMKRELALQMRRKMTPAEARLWQFLRANRLENAHFRRQQIIDGFVADFYCHAARLVVEVDGGIHAQRTEQDAYRTAAFALRGLRVARFANDAVFTDSEQVLATLREYLRAKII